MLFGNLPNVTIGNLDDDADHAAEQQAAQSASSLGLGPLLDYTLTFAGAVESDVGDNGPWPFDISNDQGAATLPPTAGTLSVTRPDGSPGSAALLLSDGGTEAAHRVGGYYLLDAPGKYGFTVSVTMADGAICVQRATVFAK